MELAVTSMLTTLRKVFWNSGKVVDRPGRNNVVNPGQNITLNVLILCMISSLFWIKWRGWGIKDQVCGRVVLIIVNVCNSICYVYFLKTWQTGRGGRAIRRIGIIRSVLFTNCIPVRRFLMSWNLLRGSPSPRDIRYWFSSTCTNKIAELVKNISRIWVFLSHSFQNDLNVYIESISVVSKYTM